MLNLATIAWQSRHAICFPFLLLASTALKADTVVFQDVAGTVQASFPGYYVTGCAGNTSKCGGAEGYPYTLASDTIPNTVYIGDPAGYVSDEIVALIKPEGDITSVGFTFEAGLDRTGTPTMCASVGGCNLPYDGSVQTIGDVTYGPGLFPPPANFSTTLEYQHVAVPEPPTLGVATPLTFLILVAAIYKRRAEEGGFDSDRAS